jgi:hypothetical protein
MSETSADLNQIQSSQCTLLLFLPLHFTLYTEFYIFVALLSFASEAEGRGQIRAPLPAPKQLPPVPDLGDLKEALSSLEMERDGRN